MAANNKNKGMFASAVNAVAGAASGVLETVGLAPAPAPAYASEPAPNASYPIAGGKRKTRKAQRKSRKASKKAHRKASKKAHRKASRKSTRRHA